jgi:hypothetical protein
MKEAFSEKNKQASSNSTSKHAAEKWHITLNSKVNNNLKLTLRQASI